MEKKTIENMDYNYDIYTQIENLKIIKEWINDIDILLKRIEKMNINNIQKQIEEAYQNGYKTCMQENDFDSPCTSCEAYQRGVEDGRNETWEVAKKVSLQVDEGGLSVEKLDEIFGCATLQQVFRRYSAQQTIAKLKAYEEKQKAENEIKVGDIVYLSGDKYIVSYINDDGCADLIHIWSGSTCESVSPDCLTRTGKHYDIDKILEAMKE